ncbi:MAG: hypothetical protein ACOCW2_01235 [Chitinivibrionales bacterium]
MDHSVEAGFSIIEIFIVIIIISMSAVVITRALKSSVGMQRDAYATELAHKEAEEKLLELAAAPFPSNGSDQSTSDNITFARRWTIDTTGVPKTVEITIQWNHTNHQRQITMMGAVP